MKRLLLAFFIVFAAHAGEPTLADLLAREDKDEFTKLDDSPKEQIRAMVARFKGYKAKISTKDDEKAWSECVDRAGKRIIERARKKVEEAEDELEQKIIKSAPSVRT